MKNQMKPFTFIVGMTLATQAARSQSVEPTGQTSEAAAVPGVVVTGEQNKKSGTYNSKTISNPKYTGPLRETPQSVTVVPQQVMQDQGVTTLRGALGNVSGISLAAGEGGSQGDNLTIRGFGARSDMFLDGMRDFGNYFRDPFNLEEVEVLKGPSSMAFGRGSTGGVVNQVSKSAGITKETEGSFTLGSDQTKRATADINQPLSERTAFRLNLMGHESNVAGRDAVQNRRFGIAPSLKFGLGTPTRVTFNYMHQSDDSIPDYGIPFIFSRPANVDRRNFYGFRTANYLRTDADVATLITEHATDGGSIVRNQLRAASYDRSLQVTAPRIAGSPAVGTALEAISVNRGQVAVDGSDTLLANDLSLTTEFDTLGARHTLITGVEVSRETSEPTRRAFTGVPTTGLTNPDPSQPFAGTGAISARAKSAVTTVAGYVTDSLKLGSFWELIAGLRWDHVDAKYEQVTPTTSTNLSRVDNAPNYRAGLVFKPFSIGTAYFSYGTSFNPSAEQLSLSAANANLEPEKNQSFELGTKWDLAEDLSVAAAVFRTEKTNARVADATNPALNVLSGKHKVDGFEVGATGAIAPRWKVFSGYTLLDAKILSSTNLAEEGARLTNTPTHTFSLWSTYDLSDRLQLGAGAIYVTERTGSTTPDANTGLIREVAGYTRFDAMAKYAVSRDVRLQLNVVNAADANYFESVYPGHVVPGAARTVLLSTLFNF